MAELRRRQGLARVLQSSLSGERQMVDEAAAKAALDARADLDLRSGEGGDSRVEGMGRALLKLKAIFDPGATAHGVSPTRSTH